MPVTAPAVAGSKTTYSVAVWLGLSASGNVRPTKLKPAPLIDAALTVTVAVPVELSVSDCVTVVFRSTGPNATLIALTAKAGVAALTVSITVPDWLPIPEADPCTVSLWLPAAADAAAVTVKILVEEVVAGCSVAVTPAGKPDTFRLTLNGPPVSTTWTMAVALWPAVTVRAGAETEKEALAAKLGFAESERSTARLAVLLG